MISAQSRDPSPEPDVTVAIEHVVPLIKSEWNVVWHVLETKTDKEFASRRSPASAGFTRKIYPANSFPLSLFVPFTFIGN